MPLPKTLIEVAKPFFKNNTIGLVKFLTVITIGTNYLQNIAPRAEVQETKRRTKKSALNSDSEQIDNSTNIRFYGLFPAKFNKEIMELCAKELGIDIIKNPDLLLIHENIILCAAWYWRSYGLGGMSLTDYTTQLDLLPIGRSSYEMLARKYFNQLER